MTEQNKAVTKVVSSMCRALKVAHGITVPHSAMRAVYLQAQGENAHAFARKLKVDEPVVALEPPVQATKPVEHKQAHTLYLAGDDLGCLNCISLDAAGTYLVPDGFSFSASAMLLSQKAEVPSIRKYGLPQYLESAAKFYDRLSLGLSNQFAQEYRDLGDDSGDSCVLAVALSKAEWSSLVEQVLRTNSELYDRVADWVGLHYLRNFDVETSVSRANWVTRYLEAMAESV